MTRHVLGASLLGTPAAAVLWSLVIIGVVGLAVLGSHHTRWRWWAITVPACAVAAALAVTIVAFLIEEVFRPFPDSLPIVVYLWAGVALFALVLGVAVTPWKRARSRVTVAVVSVALVLSAVAGAAGHINGIYAQYPTVSALLGVDDFRTLDFAEVAKRAASVTGADLPAGSPLESEWSPPPDLPTTGAVVETPIPGAVSGFRARPAQMYFPPAYFADPRPLLPVLVLLAGQPGSPADWLVSGRLPDTMDSFAAEHGGLSPIVVVADPIGDPLGNTLCVDSPQGNAQTYLTTDVPRWIRDNLQVATGPRSLAIGGLSFGGTCALQIALTAPEIFPTFLSLSAQGEPTIGDREDTIREFFGGDVAAFRAHNPADLLTTRRYVGSAGAFVYGSTDSEYGPASTQLYDAALAAGVDAHLTELPGGHSYAVWSAGLRHELGWLARRLEVTR